MAGYGEGPAPQQQQMTQQQYDQQQYGAYPEDYVYPNDTFKGMMPNDQAAQIRKAIFECVLPSEDEDFEQWIPMLTTAIDIVARIPGVSDRVINEERRRMEDIVELAHAEASEREVASKMQKMIFRLRSYVSGVETPHLGPSGIDSINTQNLNQKSEVRMPQAPATQTGFWPWSRK